MQGLKVYLPELEDLWFRERLMSDEETMSYNHHWGGTIAFPEERWSEWYRYWISDHQNRRFYRYLVNEKEEFVGEIAYHFDEEYRVYLANIIVYSKYRKLGYGRKGLEILLENAKKAGLKELYDNLAIDNPAIRLFQEFGFTEEYRTDEVIWLKKIL